MRRLRAQLALGVLLIAAPAVAAVGQVAALEGKAVRIPKAGAEQALSVGAPLELEDTVRTDSSGS
ncbi:MAG: hypothetical protein ACLQIH_12460, partial [Myxococcaceae bacterium]